jgi:hypothetical protein
MDLVEPQPLFVTVEIEPILISSVVERVPEVRALGEELTATVSADTVRVFLFGPLETVDSLEEDDVRVTLDLLNLEAGVYNIEPIVAISANEVEVRSVQPALISVIITPVVVVTETVTTTTVLQPETSVLPALPQPGLPDSAPAASNAHPPATLMPYQGRFVGRIERRFTYLDALTSL